MRKWLAVLMILGLIAGGLAGCGQKTQQLPEPPAQGTVTTITVVNMPEHAFVKGSAPSVVANLEIKPATRFTAGSTIEATLKNAKWNQSQSNAEKNQGWKYEGLFDGDLTVHYTQSGEAGLEGLTLVLPGVILGPAVESGDLIVSLSGTAGLTGEYAIGKIVSGYFLVAEKPVVKVSALEQAAGNVVIKEEVENAFSSAVPDGFLKLTLPNGVNFSRNPKVFIGDKEIVNIKVEDGGRGKNYVQWKVNAFTGGFNANRLEEIKISDIYYDIDSRFAPQNIFVAASGQLLTGPGGSLETIATVVNADARSLTSGSAKFVVGSTTAVISDKPVKMDVAPYQKFNRVFIPLRYTANALSIADSSIIWDQANQSVTLMKANNVVQVKVGSKIMTINGVTVEMDVAPEMSDNRVMLPISWVAQAFGAAVTWDEATLTTSLAF